MHSRQVRAALMERGTNDRQWALARRYEPRMVVYAVNTYAGTQRRPRGLVTHRILRDLSKFIGQDIAPSAVDVDSPTTRGGTA